MAGRPPSKIGLRAGLVVATVLLVLWALAHVECTTTEPGAGDARRGSPPCPRDTVRGTTY